MQATLNQRTKFRELFRPFAPAILAEDADTLSLPDPAVRLHAICRWVKTRNRISASLARPVRALAREAGIPAL